VAKQRAQPNLDQQLRQAIRESGLSLNALGRRAGIDHGRLSRYVRGERDLTLAAVTKLCEALGLQLARPVGGPAPPTEAIGETAGEPGSPPPPTGAEPRKARTPREDERA
jgi:transcriptional regulator with XRE-family HTH domain